MKARKVRSTRKSQKVEKHEATDGALIVIGPQVFFVPRDELRGYRVPKTVAAVARAKLEERAVLMRGHPNDAVILGVKFGIADATLGFSCIEEHCLTNSRLH